jgi:hypothetical protein
VELGVNEGASVVSRTIHNSDDHDYFLLVPDRAGILIMETTGNMDTYMELYDIDSGEYLEENDDSGSGGNARIRQTAGPGKRYIAMVRSYGSETGSYGFRAYLNGQVHTAPDEYEEDGAAE